LLKEKIDYFYLNQNMESIDHKLENPTETLFLFVELYSLWAMLVDQVNFRAYPQPPRLIGEAAILYGDVGVRVVLMRGALDKAVWGGKPFPPKKWVDNAYPEFKALCLDLRRLLQLTDFFGIKK
jgi:hypothetical protein